MSEPVAEDTDRQAPYLLEGMHCSLIESSSWRRVIARIARWSRRGRVVPVAGRSVKVHVDAPAADDDEQTSRNGEQDEQDE